MGSTSNTDKYGLRRDGLEFLRLEAQHLTQRLHSGYAMNPGIPVRSDMKIAEVATGTGVWLFDLAQELPSTVQLHGYDVSDAQFPSKDLWPTNVELGVMDAFSDPPDSLLETYDVVHIRYLVMCVARGLDLKALIRHAFKLLKPGGFLQWDEANLGSNNARGSLAKEFEPRLDKFLKDTGTDFSWVSGLRAAMEASVFTVLEYDDRRFGPGLMHLCTSTYLMGLKDVVGGIKSNPAWGGHELIPSCEALLDQMLASQRDGVVYNWCPVSLLAQKLN